MLRASVTITATDLASKCSTVLNPTPVRRALGSSRPLPFDDSSFDAILCQFGVMFFPDKEAAFREALRVLQRRARFFVRGMKSARRNRYPIHRERNRWSSAVV
jgi:ubiquinone/menaquinone biosynthesis C-methylase UbiE